MNKEQYDKVILDIIQYITETITDDIPQDEAMRILGIVFSSVAWSFRQDTDEETMQDWFDKIWKMSFVYLEDYK